MEIRFSDCWGKFYLTLFSACVCSYLAIFLLAWQNSWTFYPAWWICLAHSVLMKSVLKYTFGGLFLGSKSSPAPLPTPLWFYFGCTSSLPPLPPTPPPLSVQAWQYYPHYISGLAKLGNIWQCGNELHMFSWQMSCACSLDEWVVHAHLTNVLLVLSC